MLDSNFATKLLEHSIFNFITFIKQLFNVLFTCLYGLFFVVDSRLNIEEIIRREKRKTNLNIVEFTVIDFKLMFHLLDLFLFGAKFDGGVTQTILLILNVATFDLNI
jgi:hypothetical protein